MISGLFRFLGATGRNLVVAYTFGSFAVLVLLALGGFVLSRGTNSVQVKETILASFIII